MKRRDAAVWHGVRAMVAQKQFLTTAYGGYLKQETPSENVELTHVEKGSPAGELLRRYWQPIALTSEVGEVPLGFRMFGEDLGGFSHNQG